MSTSLARADSPVLGIGGKPPALEQDYLLVNLKLDNFCPFLLAARSSTARGVSSDKICPVLRIIARFMGLIRDIIRV